MSFRVATHSFSGTPFLHWTLVGLTLLLCHPGMAVAGQSAMDKRTVSAKEKTENFRILFAHMCADKEKLSGGNRRCFRTHVDRTPESLFQSLLNRGFVENKNKEDIGYVRQPKPFMKKNTLEKSGSGTQIFSPEDRKSRLFSGYITWKGTDKAFVPITLHEGPILFPALYGVFPSKQGGADVFVYVKAPDGFNGRKVYDPGVSGRPRVVEILAELGLGTNLLDYAIEGIHSHWKPLFNMETGK